MAEQPIMRIGVAGLGTGGANALGEAPGLASHPNIRLTAAADPRQVALDRFASEFGGETFTSIEALCASPSVDVVYIVTPSRLHAEHAILAAESGKCIMLDKPMALTLADADRVVDAVDRAGVKLMVGHSQSLDIGIIRMAEMVNSGELGRPLMIHSSFYSDWLYRPRSAEELDPANGDNLVLRQGPVQVDIARMLGGGLVRGVRASTSAIDPMRPIEGSFAAFLDFENDAAAVLEYSGYGHFDSSELTWGIGLGGRSRSPEDNLRSRQQIAGFAPGAEFEHKEATRYGGSLRRNRGRSAEQHQFFGFTLVSCERGDIRQTPRGLKIYGDEEQREIELPVDLYPKADIEVMYQAWLIDEPLRYHDARWGRATLEVCLAILQSGREHREVHTSKQTAWPPASGPLVQGTPNA
jgi:phthalate 4,5-cis-dihydrodiol dehydrogenase